MSNNAREEHLRSMPIPALLIKLSLPAIFAMFINALYNFVDAIFVGQAVGPLGIGALSIAFPLQMIEGAIGLMFGVGGASMASRFLGAGRRDDANRTLGTAMTLVFAISLTLFIVIRTHLDPVLMLLGSTPELLPYARDYGGTVLIGFIPLALAMTGNNFTRAEGNAKMSMFIMLAGALTNIILDPLFIFVLDMGVKGAAIATVIGQFLSFLLAYVYLFSPRSSYDLRPGNLIPRRELLPELLSLGFPTFVRNVGGSALAILLNNLLRIYAPDPGLMIAVVGVINRLMMFSLMPIFGLVQGMQPIAGYNFGARNYGRVREVVRITTWAATAVAMLFFLLFVLLPRTLVRLFSPDPVLIELGARYMPVVFLAMPLVGLQIVTSIYFQALGKALPAFFLSTSRQFVFLIPLMVIFARIWSVDGIMWAFPLADILATLISVIWYRADSRKLFTS